LADKKRRNKEKVHKKKNDATEKKRKINEESKAKYRAKVTTKATS
jgi:hypothetical protein